MGSEAGLGFFNEDEVAKGPCELGSRPKVLRPQPQVRLGHVCKAMGLEAGPSSSFVAYGSSAPPRFVGLRKSYQKT